MTIPKNQKNSKYWNLRSEAEKAWINQNIQNDEEFNVRLKGYYDRAILNINRTIESELSRLAIKENIDINELKQRVKDFDVQEYSIEAKRIVEEADKLRKQGRDVTYEDFSKEINERLRLYNATMRINRQELLKSLIGLNLIELGANIDANLRQKLTKDYTDEITRQAGILGEFKHPIWTGKEVAKIVMAQTGSANFSKRIWANQDALKARLDASLSVALIQGQNPKKMAQQLRDLVSKEVTNARYATERIARTESARVQTQAQLKSFRDNGYKFCKWHAEPSACKICKEIAENDSGYGVGVYLVDEVPSLPAHPNCRCGLGAYWVDKKNNLYETPNYNEQSEESGRVKKVQENNTAKLNRLFNSLNIKTAKVDDIIELGNAFNKEYNIRDNLGDKSYISNALSKYRDVGEDIPEKSWAKGSNRQIKNDLKQAFSHYPKEWSKYLDNEYMLAGKTEDRGFYVRWYATQKGDTKTPTWLVRGNRLREGVTMDQYNKFGEDLHNGKYNSIYSTGKRKTTAWHEIGHFVEEHNKDTLRISKEFVANRTKGEQPEMLRDILKAPDYDESEVTLKDNFISPYIGKVYDDATEVLSMGLESIFEPVKMGQLKYVDNNGQAHRARIEDDEEYLNLILGILLKG
ncbi:hypothetical protein FYL03_09325 [Lactobacillus salivarius]|uniref:minor capsid protein n=1 Tax=Ligilactobacillus salivarius TaxID=1624 RepID=UPI00136824E3|nr:minor capsid protein [Ligilactobacillus salivarius]MYZ05698.1 hypothetical protein [Ligilactobacillus salivarius]